MMTLEEIKRKRQEAEFAYLKERETYCNMLNENNEAIAKLNVDIKAIELDIQMKRAEITRVYSKLENAKSVYQKALIILAEKEKKALEQLKTIEND